MQALSITSNDLHPLGAALDTASVTSVGAPAGTALRQSEERYRLVAEATRDLVLEWEIPTGELRWFAAGPGMLRYREEEAGGTIAWFYERVHPDDRERLVREQEAVLAGSGTGWSGEYRFLRGDGRYVNLLHRSCVVRDRRGRPLRMVSSLMDVTERRQREEAQRFLARASALLDSSLDYEPTLAALARLVVPALADYCLVDLVDDRERIRRVGSAHVDPARQGLLRTRGESAALDADPEHHPVVRVIRSGRAILVPECTPEVLDRIGHDADHRARLDALALRSFMVVPLVAHGRVLGAITLAYGDSAAARCYEPLDLLVAEDLARRAATAIEHARLYREVRQAVEDREEVLKFVSHDLRNPLNTVTLAASFLLETEEERRSGNRRWLEAIQLAAEQMNGLIEELFEVTQSGAGAFSLDPARATAAELLDAIRNLFEPLAGAADLRLVCTEDDALPPLWIDVDQVLRVLSNLVGNAIKFTPAGGSVTVRAAVEGGGGGVRFSVVDTGPGLDEDALPHVFERYWQGRRGDRRGAGMGLAIAKGIVEAHGGEVRARNGPDAGAEFSFTLPAAGSGADDEA